MALALISEFMAAWGRGLLAGIPRPVRRLLGLGDRHGVAMREDDGFRLYQSVDGEPRDRGKVSPDALAATARRLSGSLVFCLAAKDVVRASTTLPEQARRTLAQVIDVEVERLTPFRRTEVEVAHRTHDLGDGRISLELGVVRRTHLLTVLDELSALNVHPAYIVTDLAEVARVESGAIANPAAPPPLGGAWRRAAAYVTVLLALAAVISPFVEQDTRRRAITAAEVVARPSIEQAVSLIGRLDRAEARAAVISGFGFAGGSRVAVLDALTRLLPDDSHLTRLAINGGGLKFEGQSSSVADLVARIGKSNLFANVAFRAPVARDPATGSERFHLALEIVQQ